MKFNYFKSIISVVTLSLTMGLTSCLGDLDVTPIDPSVNQEFDQDAVFAKIYATMALTGQEGPAGSGDLEGIDEGTSGFYRLLWNFNELPTDEALCSWGDVGVPELNFARWSASHSQLEGMYSRFYFGITIANHFLEKTEGMTDDKSVKQRAETRFMRALNYYYLMDFFGNVPFATIVSSEKAHQISRFDLFAFIEKELTECVNEQFEPRQAPLGRADKVATWLLLSRIYLNAEVYTGKARWSDAVTYADKVITSGYTLADNYAALFMGDNDKNADALKEIILPIRQDGINTRSYAGSLFLIASTHTQGMGTWGTSEGWGGNRGRQSLAKKFFADGKVPANADVAASIDAAGDDRAMFISYGTYLDDKNMEQVFETSLPIKDWNTFKQGVSVAKFSNLHSDGSSTHHSLWTDTDIPFFRVAEAYLTWAEANLRAGGDKKASKDKVNELRSRAHATLLTDIDLNTILDEKCREFYFEAQRRTDLIRYGYFTSSAYLWDWKGQSMDGTGVSSIYNLMPIPASDLNANENLEQNKGY